MQSHKEARLWNDVFIEAQDMLNIPRGTIKVVQTSICNSGLTLYYILIVMSALTWVARLVMCNTQLSEGLCLTELSLSPVCARILKMLPSHCCYFLAGNCFD